MPNENDEEETAVASADLILKVTLEAYMQTSERLLAEAEDAALLSLQKRDQAMAILNRCAELVRNYGKETDLEDIAF